MSNGAETRVKRSKSKILAAAEDVFLQHGFTGANMDSVADVAGVSKQTVYAHYGSKEALFIEVVEAMTGAAATDIGEDTPDILDDRPIADFLMEIAMDQLTVVVTPRLMRLRRMIIGEVERFPELGQSLYTNGPIRSVKRIERILEHYVAIGQLGDIDCYEAATHFNWIVMGAPTNRAMLLGDAGIPSRTEMAAHAKEAVRIFVSAYRVSDISTHGTDRRD